MTRSSAETLPGKSTVACSVAKLTVAATPSSWLSFFSTRAAHEAHDIPPMRQGDLAPVGGMGGGRHSCHFIPIGGIGKGDDEGVDDVMWKRAILIGAGAVAALVIAGCSSGDSTARAVDGTRVVGGGLGDREAERRGPQRCGRHVRAADDPASPAGGRDE